MRVDTRDGTSIPPPLAAVSLDPLENVIRYFSVSPVILWSPGPSQMRKLSGRMNALISQCRATELSSIVAITALELDSSSTVC